MKAWINRLFARTDKKPTAHRFRPRVEGLELRDTPAAFTAAVGGQSNIFGAGHAVAPGPDGGGGGDLPPEIRFTPGAGLTLTVTGATGTVTPGEGFLPSNGADGGTATDGNTDITSFGGISGIIHSNRGMFLTGVFLADSEPAGAGPERLTFSDPEDFADLSPVIGQTFFIGDGRRDADGSVQRFRVPTTATRLLLGFADSFAFGNPTNPPGWYDDNGGELFVTGEIGELVAPAPEVEILSATVRDFDDSALTAFSAWQHVYFDGNTRLNGTLALRGDADDRLANVSIQVIEGGQVIATGYLSAEGRASLLNRTFGTSGVLEVPTSRLLYEVSACQFPHTNRTTNPRVTLRVVVDTAAGAHAERDVASVPLLVRYTADNRHGSRNAQRGGDGWLLPTVRNTIEAIPGVTWGDMSDMNGGPFTDHGGHDGGTVTEARFSGYSARNAATARRLIRMLNDPSYGSQIAAVEVTFTAALRRAIRGVVLNDGRLATDVIRNAPGNVENFHVRWLAEITS